MTFTNLFFTYKLEDTQIKTAADPTIDIDLENGLASSIQTSIIHDKRDDRSDARKGYFLSYSVEYTGLGGDKKWVKNDVEARGFYPVYGDLIFRSRLYGARIDEVSGRKIPRTEKFTLGGSRNLRGYGYEAVGPLMDTVVEGRPLTFNQGGQFEAFTNLEFQHPLSREAGLKWVLFFDAGHAGSLDKVRIYSDYGFGFRWFSPIGVLRFEFGYPINNDVRNSSSQFHFDIGQLF